MTPLHEAARAFAAAGIPVFPCRENAKEPAVDGGFHAATCDLAQIDAWWSANPNYNVAFCPEDAGWCVIDLDPPIGLANWEYAAACRENPPTYNVATPRGGKHLYYAGSLPTTASKLGQKIDTRGRGGYVLVPPSIVDGKPYEANDVYEVAPLPAWIAETLGRSRDKATAGSDVSLDAPGAMLRARDLLLRYVQAGDVAVQGVGGDARTFGLACEILNLGLSPDEAFNQIREHWNPHCAPPWDDDELRVKIDNASRYAQNEAGAWAVPPAAEVFGAALDTLAKTLPPEKRSRFHLEDETEQEQGRDPEWLVRELIQEQSTVLLLGPSGSYKSFLALDVALAIAAGVDTFNCGPQQGPVVYAALEGKANIKRARRRAWKLARAVEQAGDFFITTAPLVALEDQVQEFGDEIAKRCQARKPRLIVLDTLTKCMAGLNENDARDAGIFTRFCDSLVEAFGCSVVAIHHTGKDEARGARGSSAFFANFDTVLEVKATQHRKAVEVWVRKHKDAEEREFPWTFQGRVIGPSLVFFPTTAEEHRLLTDESSEFEPTHVGAALQRLNAFGEKHGVSTAVLAAELVPPVENESVEHRHSSLGQISKKLGALSRAKLRAYITVRGSGIVWHLPAKT